MNLVYVAEECQSGNLTPNNMNGKFHLKYLRSHTRLERYTKI